MRPDRRVSAFICAVAVGLLTTVVPASAWAKDITVASDPVDYTALRSAPAVVRLSGPQQPDPGLSHVTLWDQAGKAVDADSVVSRSGDTLTLPVQITQNGNYTITYHLVFVDGSDTVGVVHFSVGTGTPPPVPTSQRQAQDEANAEAHDHGGVDPVGGVLLLVDVLVVAGVVLLLISQPKLRRRPRP